MYKNPISYVTGVFSLKNRQLDATESGIVAGSLRDRSSSLIESIRAGLAVVGATDVEVNADEQPQIVNAAVTDKNGPHVVLPLVKFTYEGHRFRARSRINVCKENHHSKVFFRSEPLLNDPSIEESMLQTLFLWASKIGEQIINQLATEYEKLMTSALPIPPAGSGVEPIALTSYFYFETHAADAEREEFLRELTDCFPSEEELAALPTTDDSSSSAPAVSQVEPEKRTIQNLLEAVAHRVENRYTDHPTDGWISVGAGYRRGLVKRRLADGGMALVGLCGLDPEIRALSHPSAPPAARIVAAQTANRVAAQL